MPCYRPWSPTDKMQERFEKAGKRVIRLPCGTCVGCRLDRALSWSLRCQHEAMLYDANSFVTLTYDDRYAPIDGGLDYRHVQLFLKKVRKRLDGVSPGPNRDYPIRFFCAGEYGSVNGRPHYHLLMFNTHFGDRVSIGKRLFESRLLNSLWNLGYATTGAVTPASASYVAQYSLKKVYGRVAGEEHYVDPWTGALRRPEFCTMSRKPGLGAWWYEKYSRDVFPCDYVINEGRRVRVPRFYSERYEASDPAAFGSVKEAREEAVLNVLDRSQARLEAREVITESRLSTFSHRS